MITAGVVAGVTVVGGSVTVYLLKKKKRGKREQRDIMKKFRNSSIRFTINFCVRRRYPEKRN